MKKNYLSKKLITMMTLVLCSVGIYANTAFADYYTENIMLYQGMNNSHVSELQEDLRRLGYFKYTPTGYFGSMTRQSVLNFQVDNNLPADGIVGYRTGREIKVDRVLQTAKGYLGVPYVWGGTSPAGFDCSGYIHYVLLQNELVVPRTTELLYNQGAWVAKSQLKPGDLVFFTTYKPGPSHVGFYLGNNKFIHASSGAGQIVISDLNTTYYLEHYIGAKRVI